MKHASFHSPIVVLTTIAAAVVLGGCSTVDLTPWKVAPNYRISNSGATAAAGYTTLARQYEGERRWAEAANAWRKAAAAAPQDAGILNSLGLAEARQGQFTKAISTLRGALALTAQRTQLLNNLGYALLLDGQDHEAKTILNEALSLKPDYPLARANLQRAEKSIANKPALAAKSNKPESILDPPAQPETPRLRNAADTARLISIETSSGQAKLQTQPNIGALQIRHEGVVSGTAGATSPAIVATQPVAKSITVPIAVPVEVPAAAPLHASVEIANGNGITGMATWLNGWMSAHGLKRATYLRNQLPFNTATTVVLYRPGYLKNAQELAKRLPQRVEVASAPGGPVDADLRVVLGHDFRTATPCEKVCPTYVAENPATPSVVAAL